MTTTPDLDGPFKAEDFDSAITDTELENLPFCNSDIKGRRKDQCRIFAEAANKRYRELLAEAPTVYGVKGCGIWSDLKDEDEPAVGPDTHSAKLLAIEELK